MRACGDVWHLQRRIPCRDPRSAHGTSAGAISQSGSEGGQERGRCKYAQGSDLKDHYLPSLSFFCNLLLQGGQFDREMIHLLHESFEVDGRQSVFIFIQIPHEFIVRKNLLPQCFFVDYTIADENRSLSLNKLVQLRHAKKAPIDEPVYAEEGESTDDAADHGVIFADDCVLHRV